MGRILQYSCRTKTSGKKRMPSKKKPAFVAPFVAPIVAPLVTELTPVEPVIAPNSLAEPEAEAQDQPQVQSPPETNSAIQDGQKLFIVGIGASAGGLEAFETFFRSIPPNTGLAFVLVPHLDPSHASILTEILQRCSSIPVHEAVDHMQVEADHVYVIPPNRDMAIFHGVLQLSLPDIPRGLRMPIDAFLRSLAEDQGDKAIGIVLSGTGTDGTLGLRAILGAGGITLVQEPATARYDGMPTSAIQLGYASHVLAPDKMLAAIQVSMHGLNRHQEAVERVAPATGNGINRILMLLRSATGHDFAQYKKSTIGRRIERRMSQHSLEDIEVYARYLKEHPAEIRMLFKELLINVTSFFRDPEAFAYMMQNVLPELFEGKPDGYVFRVWVAGCATGEEAYSIAILLREYQEEVEKQSHLTYRIQIYSTDLDDDAIAVARAGMYPPNIAQDVTPDRLRRFFIKEEGGYRIKKDIREMVVFAVQNVIKDPPFTRLDLLSCRNLMIYLEPELQNRLLPTFNYALKQGGVLFLSPSESIGNHPDLFVALNRKWKFYRAIHSASSSRVSAGTGLAWVDDEANKIPEEVMKKAKETNFAELTRRVLLQSYAPASVVADIKGNILFVHGDTGRYLRPAPGQATLNLVEMAREGLQVELRSAMMLAVNQNTATLNREVSVKTNGDFQTILLSVRSLTAPEVSGQGLLLISFQEISPPTTPDKQTRTKRLSGPAEVQRIFELERELAYGKESHQAIIEEQQASNEELKSTNEELQSTNEELQSTNEELETSKEELQSLNEELVTVNSELQAKIEQLANMQNDMKNLLDNINIGTIFLDINLRIRRFTRDASKVYRLVATDVGRSLADIKADILGDDLVADARGVLDTLMPREREVQTSNGAWYLARIQPYRTLDNMIDGVVLTFADISARIAAEAAIQSQRHLAEAIVDTVREPLLVLDENWKVISVSQSFLAKFKVSAEETMNKIIFDLGNRQWDIPALHELLENILLSDQSFEGFLVEHDFPNIGHQKMLLNARRIISPSPMILLAMEPIEGEGG
jgi:two-component system CheB/CheR fusion protein